MSQTRSAARRVATDGEVHLWTATLKLPVDVLEKLAQSLSQEERERALRFRFQIHRDRFIAGRGLLRNILGSYLDANPRAIELVFGPFGKPGLGGALAGSGPQFNLAHCEDVAVFAVTRVGRVGVDVERVRWLEDTDELVARFFSAQESRAFAALDETAKPAAFFNLWTRKEAWLKATGEGIGRLLNRVEVSFLPGGPPLLRQLPAGFGKPQDWTLHSAEPASGFVAAVAVEGEFSSLQWRPWQGY